MRISGCDTTMICDSAVSAKHHNIVQSKSRAPDYLIISRLPYNPVLSTFFNMALSVTGFDVPRWSAVPHPVARY